MAKLDVYLKGGGMIPLDVEDFSITRSAMTGMWDRWARRHRITGLGFLVGAAVAIATAALLFTLGHGYWSGALIVTATACLIHAGFEFHDGAKYARLAS